MCICNRCTSCCNKTDRKNAARTYIGNGTLIWNRCATTLQDDLAAHRLSATQLQQRQDLELAHARDTISHLQQQLAAAGVAATTTAAELAKVQQQQQSQQAST